MDTSYLKYIPNLVTNTTTNAVLLTVVPGILYTFAAYGHLFIQGASLSVAIAVSIFFAALEYIVRVPIIKYSSTVAGMSNGVMQIVWVLITLILGWASGWIMPKV